MRKLLTFLILCFSLLLLGACTAKSPTTTVPDETDVAISEATPATIVPISLEPPVDYCIECHTDKEMLIETAATEEEDAHGEESEGVG
jgi:hypothetical protein